VTFVPFVVVALKPNKKALPTARQRFLKAGQLGASRPDIHYEQPMLFPQLWQR
jgi:hypothetical protein